MEEKASEWQHVAVDALNAAGSGSLCNLYFLILKDIKPKAFLHKGVNLTQFDYFHRFILLQPESQFLISPVYVRGGLHILPSSFFFFK